MKYSLVVVKLLIISVLWTCKPMDEQVHNHRAEQWLAIGHMRSCEEGEAGMPARFERINFNRYDLLLLTGDLSCGSSQSIKQLRYLDSLLYIRQPNTLWALGDHDYQRPASISLISRRPSFYTYYQSGVTFVVLDNQQEGGQFRGEQLYMLEEVMDTIAESSHLIVLHHKLFWMYNHPQLHSRIDSISNAPLCETDVCLNPNNFYDVVYPGLVNVQRRGIQVICLGGDIGVKTAAFEYHTEEGIVYLASGLEAKQPANRALLFEYLPSSRQLKWKFVDIEKLPIKISI